MKTKDLKTIGNIVFFDCACKSFDDSILIVVIFSLSNYIKIA